VSADFICAGGALWQSAAGAYSCAAGHDSEAQVDVANNEARSMAKSTIRSAAKRKRKLFHATVQVTRVEDWCVEAESAEEARALLARGEGERFRLGDCVHLEIQDVAE
jgi:hypothetical protein